eukprot:gb/GEZN01006019.1/.p1 GENE.gb/GEZN01006019.1/~~gb/GEZN01006019.1/.p1  ORF type:complete len:374 (+),score=63.69 gb/GEZN01006019.1/:395-1516(+)
MMGGGERAPGETSEPSFLDEIVEEDDGIDEKVLASVKLKVRKADNYVLESVENRNVLMVGRIRSGKTTAVGVLKDTCYQPQEFSIFAGTAAASFQPFSLTIKDKSAKMSLNMIDTPGLFEIKEKQGSERSNAQLLSVISSCMRMEITKIHCVVVFASFELGINVQDMEAIRLFKQMFQGCNIRLCITRSETKPLSWRKSLVEQLKAVPEVKDIADILWMGCFDKSLNPASDDESATKMFKKIYQMRKHFLESIFSMKQPTAVSQIGLVKMKIGKYRELLKTYRQALEQLAGMSDFKTNAAHLKMSEAAELMAQVQDEAGDISIFESSLVDEMQRLRVVVDTLHGKLGPQEFASIAGIIQFKRLRPANESADNV